MKTFQTVIFVIAMVVASTQTMRQVYVKWIAPADSVLDQFRTEAESEIAAADSLEQLVPLYAEAQAKVRAYEADPDNPAIDRNRRRTTEPYESELKLREAIERREDWQHRIVELWFFWVGGVVGVAAGIVVLGRFNRWLGMSGILVGYTEMLFWTSPLVHRRYAGSEFDALINFKLLLSAVTLVSLVVLWMLSSRGALRSGGGNSG